MQQPVFYGFKLGAELALRGRVRDALPYLIRPVNYWRTIEYRLVLEAGDFRSGERVLDVGSPKLLALYLAEVVGARVVTSDIESYFVDRIGYIARMRKLDDRLEVRVEDGRRLKFEDASFDKAYSISVLEHIPESGDTECIREIARVLRPGGRVALTVPFAPVGRDEYKSGGFYWAGSSSSRSDGAVFYQRRYSEEDLSRRLIEPSGLRLVRRAYVGERLLQRFEKLEVSTFLPTVSGPVQPLLSRALHTGPLDDWRKLEKPLCALVVLEKPDVAARA